MYHLLRAQQREKALRKKYQEIEDLLKAEAEADPDSLVAKARYTD